ncbi:MAG: hypothetical protein CML31_05625 [Rhizobiales bacterium]|nr:hypothetical protein [Hoeflea sp.]MBG19433.1 hypothetical protein [Hyphomicrobiales bacterium]|tara:strand:- start:1943 stop:2359 length:417 start_codon:yes stop_codon:yes gene_type:complete
MGPDVTRHLEWEKRLNGVLETYRDLPGDWGVSDCWIMATDAYLAVTGETLLPELRQYRSEKAGYRLFAKHGFTTVGQALASELEAVNRLKAKRGDLCTIERDSVEACGVIMARGVAVKSLTGLDFYPLTEIKQAFRVY